MKSASTTKYKTVDEYLSVLPADIRPFIKDLRKTIREAAPEAREVISYNMPAIKINGVLVYYAAHSSHIGFYPTPSAIEAFKKELAEYESSKGAVKFPISRPVPHELVAKIVKFRVHEDLEKSKARLKK